MTHQPSFRPRDLRRLRKFLKTAAPEPMEISGQPVELVLTDQLLAANRVALSRPLETISQTPPPIQQQDLERMDMQAAMDEDPKLKRRLHRRAEVWARDQTMLHAQPK